MNVARLIMTLSVAAFVLWSAGPARAERFAEQIAAAAQDWLIAIGPAAQSAQFAFDKDERVDWHFIPRRRQGIAFRDMNDVQRQAAKTLMRSTLSSQGVLKADAIMALEAVLADIEGSSLSYRDPMNYLISVFGTPGRYPWGWRLEGHHLSINVTAATADAVSVTPVFAGSNPARVPAGPQKGKQVQYDEFILAIRLARTLSAEQRAAATLGTRALGNIVTGPGRADAIAAPVGLPANELTRPQRLLLMELVASYVGLARDEIGLPYMQIVEDGLADTTFAWAGPVSEVEPFYYRIHGPRILIEFDNSQNNANHIHSLWRDPLNDFGHDDLMRHYKEAPIGHGHKHP